MPKDQDVTNRQYYHQIMAIILFFLLFVDATVITFNFVLFTTKQPLFPSSFAKVVIAILTLAVWIICSSFILYFYRHKVRGNVSGPIIMLVLSAPMILWTRLFIADYWLPFSSNQSFFLSPPILGTILGALVPFLIIGLFSTLRWLFSSTMSRDRFKRLVVLSLNAILAMMLLGGAFILWTFRENPGQFPSSAQDFLLFFGFELLLLAGLMVIIRIKYYSRGRLPMTTIMKDFVRANIDRAQTTSNEPFFINDKTTKKGRFGILITCLAYAVSLLIFLAIFFKITQFLQSRPIWGWLPLGLSLLISLAVTIIDVRKKSGKNTLLASLIFCWIAPLCGGAAWFLMKEKSPFFLELMVLPIIVWGVYSIMGWLPRHFAIIRTKVRVSSIEKVLNKRAATLRQLFLLTKGIKNQLYKRQELEVWQIIVAVAIWGFSWGIPHIASLTNDKAAKEFIESISSFHVPVAISVAWMMIALFPMCRIATIAGTINLLKPGNLRPGSFLSLLISLFAVLMLTYFIFPLLIVFVTIMEAIFGQEGLALLVEYYLFPIALPMLYSFLLSIWLLLIINVKSRLKI